MPEKVINAIAIRPVSSIVIPSPRNGFGMFEYFSFSRIAAIEIIASIQPTPDEIPKTVDCPKVYFRSIINKDTPRIAQFTVISGKNIPKATYSFMEIFSIAISAI